MKEHLSALFPFILCITEALDSRFETLEWKQTAERIEGLGTIEGERIQLLVEPATLTVNGQTVTYLNVAFARAQPDGSFSMLLLNTDKNVSKIVGATVAALKEKVAELEAKYKVDALLFGATPAEKKRLQLYRRLVSSKAYGVADEWPIYKENIKLKNGEAILAMSKSFDRTLLADLETELEHRGKVVE